MQKEGKKTAAALRYDPERDEAPKVIAGGYGERAERILAKARELNIPIHEEPDLARVLVGLEIGGEIPPELYQAVASILVFVQGLDEKISKKVK